MGTKEDGGGKDRMTRHISKHVKQLAPIPPGIPRDTVVGLMVQRECGHSEMVNIRTDSRFSARDCNSMEKCMSIVSYTSRYECVCCIRSIDKVNG